MKKFIRFGLSLGLIAMLPASALALSPGNGDHQLLCGQAGCPVAPDTAIYCGASMNPWVLDWQATAGGFDAEVKLVFHDGDFIRFKVPAGTSFSAHHALGLVQRIDNVVKLEPNANVEAMMATTQTRPAARDPFDETLDGGGPERTNYCVTCSSAGGTNDPGCTSASALIP